MTSFFLADSGNSHDRHSTWDWSRGTTGPCGHDGHDLCLKISAQWQANTENGTVGTVGMVEKNGNEMQALDLKDLKVKMTKVLPPVTQDHWKLFQSWMAKLIQTRVNKWYKCKSYRKGPARSLKLEAFCRSVVIQVQPKEDHLVRLQERMKTNTKKTTKTSL